jgi:hypothetical protein
VPSRFSLNLPFFDLGPSSKGLGTNLMLSTNKIAWIHWSLELGPSSKVTLNAFPLASNGRVKIMGIGICLSSLDLGPSSKVTLNDFPLASNGRVKIMEIGICLSSTKSRDKSRKQTHHRNWRKEHDWNWHQIGCNDFKKPWIFFQVIPRGLGDGLGFSWPSAPVCGWFHVFFFF